MSFVPDVNSMLRTADTTVTAAETHNAGNAKTLDLGAGAGLRGLWLWVMNPTAVTGTTPGYTITIKVSADKSSWSNLSPSQVVTVVAAGEYGPFRIDTALRYISYDLALGNADNSASALAMGLTDGVRLGPR